MKPCSSVDHGYGFASNENRYQLNSFHSFISVNKASKRGSRYLRLAGLQFYCFNETGVWFEAPIYAAGEWFYTDSHIQAAHLGFLFEYLLIFCLHVVAHKENQFSI
jgi:hypothetical protein